METKHTPGPWNIHKYSDDEPFIVKHDGKEPWIAMDIAIGSGETLIALVQMCTSNDAGYPHIVVESECRSNARLIAAAPELLEALVAITNQLERIGDTRPHKDGQFIDAARAAIAKATGQS